MSRALKATAPMDLTPEQRKERRALRREKQRLNNIPRAAKMHKARLKSKAETPKATPTLLESLYVGCSGWRYWKWRDSFYAAIRQADWFAHYSGVFDTI